MHQWRNIVQAQDIPGKNCITLIIDDQPCLADEVVNHAEEPILLLAHPDKYLLEEARRAVQIEIDPLPPVFTMEESLARKEIIWGSDNVFKSFVIEKGNVDEVWASADLIVEGRYETGAQEQLYIEPQGMIATANEAEGVTVWGSLQCPYYVDKALAQLFTFPKERIRVVQAETGGGEACKRDCAYGRHAFDGQLPAGCSSASDDGIHGNAVLLVTCAARHDACIRRRYCASSSSAALITFLDGLHGLIHD